MPDARTIDLNSVFGGATNPKWLLKSFYTTIPSILKACSESRDMALKVLTPAFETTIASGAGIVTYINFEVDTIAISLHTVQSMFSTMNPTVIRSREKLRNIACYMKIFPPNPPVRDICRLVLNNAVTTWRNVQT